MLCILRIKFVIETRCNAIIRWNTTKKKKEQNVQMLRFSIWLCEQWMWDTFSSWFVYYFVIWNYVTLLKAWQIIPHVLSPDHISDFSAIKIIGTTLFVRLRCIRETNIIFSMCNKGSQVIACASLKVSRFRNFPKSITWKF